MATRCPCHTLWTWVGCWRAASVSCCVPLGVQGSLATLRAPQGWGSLGLLTETVTAWRRLCQSSTLATSRPWRLLCLEPGGKSPVLPAALGFAGCVAVFQPLRLWGCNHRIYVKESYHKGAAACHVCAVQRTPVISSWARSCVFETSRSTLHAPSLGCTKLTLH